MPDRHGGLLADAGLAAPERSQGGAGAVPPAARSQAPALAAQDPAGAEREVWRRIPMHAWYEASSHGRVRSVPRTLANGRQTGGQVLTPTFDKDGYPRVQLGRRKVRVHVAVALAFHGAPEVLHGDGNRQNCRPENLHWGTRLENERDKREGNREAGQSALFRDISRTGLISLSEAASQGVVTGSLAALRKCSQRDGTFPVPVGLNGLAKLYDIAELSAWERRRK